MSRVVEEKTPESIGSNASKEGFVIGVESIEEKKCPGGHVGDNVALESNDKVLAEKMFLINNAIDEIGFTWYHVKLFFLAGFG